MSGETQKPDEKTEVVRKLVVPPKSQGVPDDGDRSPSKTERDAITAAPSATEAAMSDEVAVVRKLVVPQPPTAPDDGDRSPSKTERHLT
jgi:hypothetical protein